MICKCRCVHHITLRGLFVMLAFNFDGLVVMLELTEDTQSLDSRMYTKLESPVILADAMVNDASKLIISVISSGQLVTIRDHSFFSFLKSVVAWFPVQYSAINSMV